MRYHMAATPLVASLALRETETLETNQPFAPDCPERSAIEIGAIVSTETVMDRFASSLPALSTAKNSIVCVPSETRNGPEYSVQRPASIRYEMTPNQQRQSQ